MSTSGIASRLPGLGEAGFTLARAIAERERGPVFGFDLRAWDPVFDERLCSSDVLALGSLEELAHSTNVVIGLTSASSALTVAETLAPYPADTGRCSLRAPDWESREKMTRAVALFPVEDGE